MQYPSINKELVFENHERRVDDKWPEQLWRRCFVYADYLGAPINDGGWLVGQILFQNPVGETVLTLAVVNTDHRVQIQTLYDNRFVLGQ